MTSVFLKRFFGKMPYKDIAEIHDIFVQIVHNHYQNARLRLLEIIIELDRLRKKGPKRTKPKPEPKKPLTPEEKAARKEKRRQAVNAWQRRYYLRNREKLLAKRKQYDQDHPEHAKEYRLKKKRKKRGWKSSERILDAGRNKRKPEQG